MLNNAGFNWTAPEKDNFWCDKFEQLKQYKAKHGDCNVPARYKENQSLASWVQRQRARYKQLELQEEHINMLNNVGFNWTAPARDYSSVWNEKFEQLNIYKAKHGDCNVPERYKENQSLASWVQRQRARYKQLELQEERINMLNNVGFNWTAPARDYSSFWNEKFEQLNIYKAKHGDCNVPERYKENQSLASWVQRQRARYKQLELQEERINMLNNVGFNWTAPARDYSSFWNEKLEQLNIYKAKHGDCNVPARYKENQSLASWVHRQRARYKQLELQEERINMLNNVGFNWTPARDYSSVWNEKLEQLNIYKAKHGDCNVPARYKENQSLASWVQRQRARYKQLKLSEEHINMLNNVGFDWTSQDSTWFDSFEQLKQYKAKHGDCNVKWDEPLANWIYNQRSRYKHSKLSEERINMLNGIGVDWTSPSKGSKTTSNDLTEQEDSESDQSHEQIAIEINVNETRIEGAIKENVEISCTRSLQDRIQELCKLSLRAGPRKNVRFFVRILKMNFLYAGQILTLNTCNNN